MNLTAHDIQGLRDPLLLDLLDNYQVSFPLSEHMPLSWWIETIEEVEDGTAPHRRLQAMLDGEKFVGWTLYEQIEDAPDVGYLWYLAVEPDLRGGGYGSAIYRHALSTLFEKGCRILVFEIEIPEVEATISREAEKTARRRLDWYLRLGAKRLTGIHYIQDVTWWPKKLMHVMIHSTELVTPQEAFDAAKLALEEEPDVSNLNLAGTLGLA